MKNKWTMQPAEFLRPYDLVLKTEKLENVRVVMITSHHTILYSDGRSIVFQPRRSSS